LNPLRSRRDKTPFETYLTEIAATPLLTREQEIDLAHRIKDGDESARDHLVRANLRLVVSIAKAVKQVGSLTFEDMISEGNLGLIRATRSYDPDRFRVRFSSYAHYWIKRFILHAIRDNGSMIRVPAYLHYTRQTVHNGKQKRSDLKPGHRACLKAAERVLDWPTGDLSDLSLRSSESVPSPCEGLPGYADILPFIDALPGRKAAILKARWGLGGKEPKTIEQTGALLGITKQWVSKQEQQAIKMLQAQAPRMRRIVH
jgi:RNA polymerase primary sigma factor